MSAATFDISVNQNATFKTGLVLSNGSGSYLDITNWDFSASIKVSPNAAPVASFSIAVTSFPSASLDMTLTATQSERLTAKKYLWDLIAVNKNIVPAEVYRLLEGHVLVSPGVTQI